MNQSRRPARARSQRGGNVLALRQNEVFAARQSLALPSLALPANEHAARDKRGALSSESSPTYGDTRVQTIIRHSLKRGRVHQYRKFGGELATDLIVRRNDSRANENGGNAGVLGRAALKTIDILAFPGDGALAPN